MKLRSSFAVTLVLLVAFPTIAFAQLSPRGIAEFETAVNSATIEDGDILVLTENGVDRAIVAYDANLVGVVAAEPAVAWSTIGRDNTVAVIRQGSATIRVSTSNGPIHRGDWITSSNTAGVGVRATQPGYAVGRALADFDGTQSDIGLIPITVEVQFAIPNNADAPAPFTLKGALDTVQAGFRIVSSGTVHFSIRYTIAALVVLISACFGYWIISRATATGIAAIGRNPLARGAIIITTGASVMSALAIIAGGVVFGIFILAL
jgi:hypothetical protein